VPHFSRLLREVGDAFLYDHGVFKMVTDSEADDGETFGYAIA
jgi:hypothetical protein